MVQKSFLLSLSADIEEAVDTTVVLANETNHRQNKFSFLKEGLPS